MLVLDKPNFPIEFGSLVMLVPDKSNSINEVKFLSEPGSSFNPLHPDNEKFLSFTNAPSSSGKSVRPLHSSIFNSINDTRSPMKLSILFKLKQSAIVNLSKRKHLEKFGIVVMPEHRVTDRTFKFCALYKKWMAF